MVEVITANLCYCVVVLQSAKDIFRTSFTHQKHVFAMDKVIYTISVQQSI